MRVLIVVADRPLATVVDLTLQHGRFERRTAGTITAATEAFSSWQPQLLIVDLDLDGGAGLTLAGSRSERGPVPVIVLTRRGDLKGKLRAFDRGADDYITLPLEPDDLLARCHAVLRRAYGAGGALISRIRVGDLEIDMLNRTVIAGTSELHLSSLEQALLYLLAANAGTVLTREQILDALWGTDYVTESNVIDRQVRALRVKLQNDWRRPRYIETVHGQGYRFLPAAPE